MGRERAARLNLAHAVLGFSPEQVLFCSVKGGVGLSAAPSQTAISQFCVTAPGEMAEAGGKSEHLGYQEMWLQLSLSTLRPRQQLILSVVKTGFEKGACASSSSS